MNVRRGSVPKDAGKSSRIGLDESAPVTADSGVTGAAAVAVLTAGRSTMEGKGLAAPARTRTKASAPRRTSSKGRSVVKKHRVLNTAAEIAEDLVTRDRARKRLLNKRELHPCAENLLCVENRRG